MPEPNKKPRVIFVKSNHISLWGTPRYELVNPKHAKITVKNVASFILVNVDSFLFGCLTTFVYTPIQIRLAEWTVWGVLFYDYPITVATSKVFDIFLR